MGALRVHPRSCTHYAETLKKVLHTPTSHLQIWLVTEPSTERFIRDPVAFCFEECALNRVARPAFSLSLRASVSQLAFPAGCPPHNHTH